ncbi:MAG TPA: ABC transporter ATP-binding protein [Allosphingosinicella sp.]|jgi:ABC-2 type transport system ATP-binding protein
MPQSPDAAPVAELIAVVKRRGRVTALDGISLAFAPGEVTALLGPNGAGKSTTVAMLTGRLSPDRGNVHLFAGSPQNPRMRSRMGVMLQQAGMPRGLRVAEQIDLFRGYYPAPRTRAEAVAASGLNGLEHRRCTALSGGEQRRLQFALAICGRPDFLVLDEPSAGMDVESRRGIWAAVRAEVARGAAILLTTHQLDEAEALADRVVVIDRGRIIADGSPQSIKADAAASALRCRSKLFDSALAALTGVVSVVRDGGRVTLLTTRPQATVRELIDLDPGLEDLTLSAASLEDAFTRLVDGAAAPVPQLELVR